MTDLFNTRYGWILRAGLVDYKLAWKWQKSLVNMRREGLARDTILMLEHPPVVTVGKDGHKENFAKCDLEPIHIERGGDVTYHGPGQLVVYFIFNLTRRGRDVRKFITNLQQGIVDAFADLGIECTIRKGEHTGVWVGDRKIASLGVAVKRWITYHGVAINLNTDLSEFNRINPCGFKAETMISARELIGKDLDIENFADILLEHYANLFVTKFEPVDLASLAEELESQAGGYTI
ncbi:MAG TPA: lipoyl(octanoyl) transferase LipB [candidate division Zixibacteria bacterium]|nr:lipoyl(octanoyl) transferase LipB [candidate division Zixibacteria bacterium]